MRWRRRWRTDGGRRERGGGHFHHVIVSVTVERATRTTRGRAVALYVFRCIEIIAATDIRRRAPIATLVTSGFSANFFVVVVSLSVVVILTINGEIFLKLIIIVVDEVEVVDTDVMGQSAK